MYSYFISYSFTKGRGYGFANKVVEVEKEIETIEDIELIEIAIGLSKDHDSIAVINYKKIIKG